MPNKHAVVWIDHLKATVIRFSNDSDETSHFTSERSIRQLHRKSGVPGSGHAPDDHVFFDAVAKAVADAREVLIVGPGMGKKAFESYVETRHPDVAKKVVGVETVIPSSDAELLALARKHFKRIQQLRLDVASVHNRHPSSIAT